MVSRRTLIDVEDFNRRRGVAALVRGDSLDLEEVPPRPNAAIAGGVIVALLLSGASVATAYLTGRAPEGWRSDGTLVLDEATGARYVAQDGALHPAPTLTSALLAGARSTPVLVPHAAVAGTRVGPALPGQDLPERPPALPATPTGFVACWDGASLDVYAGAPAVVPSPAEGALVSGPDGGTVLVSGRSGYPISPAAVTALGYDGAAVRPVPAAWLALVPPGPALDLLAPPVDPGRGVTDVGTVGEVVVEAGSGSRFLVQDGRLAPFANETSERLAPAPVREVPRAAVLAAPPAPPAGVVDAPSSPPTVPRREDPAVPCVSSSDGTLTMAAQVSDARTAPSTEHLLGGGEQGKAADGTGGEGAVPVRWHFRPGRGALVGPTDLDEPVAAGEDRPGRIRLVDAGVGYPVQDPEALDALGYRREQTVLLPESWLALTVRGGDIASSR